jgi:hypothetical protein
MVVMIILIVEDQIDFLCNLYQRFEKNQTAEKFVFQKDQQQQKIIG